MKFINFYTGIALMLIVSLSGSLGATTGKLAPPLIVGALLLAVLVMGWAGAASEALAEIDRLKCIMHNQNTEARLRAAEAVKRDAEILRQRRLITSIQEDNLTWREGCNTYIPRIAALLTENAELRKRPSIDVLTATAQRLIVEINNEPDDVDEDCRNCQARGIGYLHSELLMHMTAVPVPAGAEIEPIASTV